MRKLTILGFCLALLAAGVRWSNFRLETAQATGDQSTENLGFGLRIAGTYLNENYVLNGVPIPPTFKNLATLSADGTYVATETNDFDLLENEVPPGDGFESPQHGTWVRTGPREITTVGLYFDYDVLGQVEFIVKVRLVGHYSDDFNTGNFSFEIELFPPDGDPVEGVGFPAGGGTFTGRRLEVR
jgi:hypothetical protein